jgi:hypothetical protein
MECCDTFKIANMGRNSQPFPLFRSWPTDFSEAFRLKQIPSNQHEEEKQ